MRDMVEEHPLLGQIALLYYKSATGRNDNRLANYILDQLGKMDYVSYYEQRLFDEHGISRPQWDKVQAKLVRANQKLWETGDEEKYEVAIEKIYDDAGINDFDAEEIGMVETSIDDYLLIQIGNAMESTRFDVKLGAIDIIMHNFHAGIAPGEILGFERDELVDLAVFLKNADVDQLGFVVRGMEEGRPEEDRDHPSESPVLATGSIEGRMPSGRPIRFGDRRPRPIRVRPHRRRR